MEQFPIGASTREAQKRIGFEMANILIDYFNGITPKSIVNKGRISLIRNL